ncbi:RasGAP-activating-like protein 1 [Heterocephalus glaber]|uniref:RasGAP-activating-like protein 1 n=1 Tax=Heterocephalus glaber TaxID=10181 RepID=G5AKW2_HETGA|nr:RasGAP-activating-like protein 1 [Heterocephalus glaber]
MAKSSSLHIRVVEGRALPAKDVSGSSDPYCLVKVDDEVVARTATVWRSLSPFWGEEYTVHLPLDFHHLAFYVLDEDTVGHDDVIGKISLSKEAITADPRGGTATVWRSLSPFWGEEYTVHLPLDFHHLAFYVLDEDTVGHDDVIGKISLSKEAITADPRGIDSWINLSRVNPDAEVQGEVRLAVQLLQDSRGRCLRCHLLQARDLAPRDMSGTSDPFARIFWGSQSWESSIIKKTRFPHWDEVLELREVPGAPAPLRVELWDWDMVGKNDFLGMVEFPAQVLQHKPPNGWFRLQPFPSAEEDSGGSLGAVRLKVRLAEDRVLPSKYYRALTALLLESVRNLSEEDTASPLAVLEELTSGDCRQDLATKLVKLFLGQGLAGPFLDYLTRREVARTTDPNTLFRSNSLASKAVEQFMKLVGMHYLHEVLKPVLNRVFEEKKYMELDPGKMDLGRARRISFKGTPSEEQVRETSLGLLTGYLGLIVDAMVGSVGRCPPTMRLAFRRLQQRVEERFPAAEHEDVKYLAVSGFLFLRFFAPAILTPKLFDLRDQHADPQTSRSLLLLAKAVQSIGNLGQQLGQGKELWMAPLHPFLLQSIARVRDFLDQLVDVQADEVSHICAVERVDEGAFQLPHVMQVVTRGSAGTLHTTYLQCKNVNELNQWLSALRKASAPNQEKLAACHPGAFRGGRWTCCLQAERSAAGCSRTHAAVTLGDWSDPLDPDAEAQMVYRQLVLGRDQLRLKVLEESNPDAAGEADSVQGSCLEALARQKAAAAHLLEVLEDLDHAHEEFQWQGQGKVALGPRGS